jgi:hypothetical protein
MKLKRMEAAVAGSRSEPSMSKKSKLLEQKFEGAFKGT